MLGLIGSDGSARGSLCQIQGDGDRGGRIPGLVCNRRAGTNSTPSDEAAALEVYAGMEYQGERHANQRARAVYLLGWMKPGEQSRRKRSEKLSKTSVPRSADVWRSRWGAGGPVGRVTLLEDRLRREPDEKVLDKIVQALRPGRCAGDAAAPGGLPEARTAGGNAPAHPQRYGRDPLASRGIVPAQEEATCCQNYPTHRNRTQDGI